MRPRLAATAVLWLPRTAGAQLFYHMASVNEDCTVGCARFGGSCEGKGVVWQDASGNGCQMYQFAQDCDISTTYSLFQNTCPPLQTWADPCGFSPGTLLSGCCKCGPGPPMSPSPPASPPRSPPSPPLSPLPPSPPAYYIFGQSKGDNCEEVCLDAAPSRVCLGSAPVWVSGDIEPRRDAVEMQPRLRCTRRKYTQRSHLASSTQHLYLHLSTCNLQNV